MKTISTYNLGPGWAMHRVELRMFDGEDIEDLRAVAMEVNRAILSSDVPSGIFYSGKFEQDHQEPLLILLNERRKERLVANTLPHELCHLVGFLCKRYKTDLQGENAAYTMGFLNEACATALKAHLESLDLDPAPTS